MYYFLSAARFIVLPFLVFTVLPAYAKPLHGEEPALGPTETRITQDEITNNGLSLNDIRSLGLRMFATQFRRSDGYGDGPINFADTLTPGGRPTLQDNGTFLRVNGLDGQACLDCHAIISADTTPVMFGIGGAGGLNNSAMFMTASIDVADFQGNGFADFNGRLINPPALFGTGAVQMIGKEMTMALQKKKAKAIARPGKVVKLRANGVEFGTIVANDIGQIDTSKVQGIDDDLIVRPFGRKGEFTSVRSFDLGALMFHFGMQPIEVVGENVDYDEDGVVNEVLAGEVSALEIFITTQDTPVQLPQDNASKNGFRIFQKIGCADCHIPKMTTRGKDLEYAFPEVEDEPSVNIFYSVDLTEKPPAFDSVGGGISVKLFSDLKRHDMGDHLAENFHAATEQQNREFITAKLWGVADTAPYLHDGRALTLNEAIMLHGGAAAGAQADYVALDITNKNYLLAFLKTLRNPANPNVDVVPQ